MKKRFSLLIPSRERTPFLSPLVESIFNKTKEKEFIEVLFIIDDDDRTTKIKVESLQEEYKDKLDIKIHVRRRSIFLNRDYYTYLATKAIGDFLWVLGDDIRIYVDNWDIIIGRGIEHYFETRLDRIVCASIRDNTPKPNDKLPKFPCFPMFSKEAFQVTGMLLHPKIPTWGADYVAYMIYSKVDRLLEFKDIVYLNHISNHTHQVPVDRTNERIGAIFNQLKNVSAHNIQRIEREECPAIRQSILNHIHKCKTKI